MSKNYENCLSVCLKKPPSYLMAVIPRWLLFPKFVFIFMFYLSRPQRFLRVILKTDTIKNYTKLLCWFCNQEKWTLEKFGTQQLITYLTNQLLQHKIYLPTWLLIASCHGIHLLFILSYFNLISEDDHKMAGKYVNPLWHPINISTF